MFEVDSADTCAGKFPLVLMGAKRRVSRVQNQERGPPLALAEIYILILNKKNCQISFAFSGISFVLSMCSVPDEPIIYIY
jgi:hypothetical protein